MTVARTHDLDRWLYRGGRPNRLARLINTASARLAAAGHGHAQMSRLEVRGRRSRQSIRFPVFVADYAGDRYLVSMLGENTNWVRNVRAAQGDAVLTRGRPEQVHLEEVDPNRREILRRYLTCAPGARAHIDVSPDAPLEELALMAPRYPVFRVTTR